MKMDENLSRRSLLSLLWKEDRTCLRPPWSSDEIVFLSACTQCGECISVCPGHILVKDKTGYPVIEFIRGECTFCGKCADTCQPGAIAFSNVGDPEQAWDAHAEIGADCLLFSGTDCRRCIEACAGNAINYRPGINFTHHIDVSIDQCTGCGACVQPCPVNAISVQ